MKERLRYRLLIVLLKPFLNNTNRSRVLIIAGGNIVVCNSYFGPGFLGLPGGGIKKHEDRIQGACREVAEETGLKLEQADIKYLTDIKRHEHGILTTLSLMVVKLDTQARLKPHLGLEISLVKWVEPNKLKSDECEPELNLMVAAYQKGLLSSPAKVTELWYNMERA